MSRKSASRCGTAAPSSVMPIPEDLLGALIFFASSDSDFVTGQSLVVDGGSVNN